VLIAHVTQDIVTYFGCATHILPRVRREPLEVKGLSDVINQHPPVFGGCQEQVAYANNTRTFLGTGAYTASDNALRLKAVWPRETKVSLRATEVILPPAVALRATEMILQPTK